MNENEKLQIQLKEMRTLIQEMGWEEFMTNLACLMAEQSCNTGDQEQSGSLGASHNTIMALIPIWKKCGKYKYPDYMGIVER